MQPAQFVIGKFNPRSSLIATITDVQELIKQLYAACANRKDGSGSWSSADFSENKHNRFCPVCSGNPAVVDIDPHRMIAPELSLRRGAVLLWAGTKCAHVEMIKQLAKVLQLDYDRPLEEQDKAFTDILMYGYENELLVYTHKKQEKYGFYRGCVNDAKYLRDSGTTSKGNLRAIEYFSGPVHCPSCSQGSNYNQVCLSIKVCGLTIEEFSKLAIDELQLSVQKLHDWEGDGCEALNDIAAELEVRLAYLHKLGLKYLSPQNRARSMHLKPVTRGE